jgi:hypothetical protein
MNKLTTRCVALTLCLAHLIHAQDMDYLIEPTERSGFFLGLGSSYNTVRFDQHLEASATVVVDSGVVVAFGETGDSANPIHTTEATLAPEIQLGWINQSSYDDLFWGLKFKYKYLGLTATNSDVTLPNGVLTETGSAPPETIFTNHIVVGSYQSIVNHEFDFMVFGGHDLGSGQVYLGIGPVLFGTESKINQATSYVTINGVDLDFTGSPVTFSSTQWIWGAALQMGTRQSLGCNWYVDVNYSIAVTGRNVMGESAAYESASVGLTNAGTISTRISQRLIAQAFSVSLNNSF